MGPYSLFRFLSKEASKPGSQSMLAQEARTEPLFSRGLSTSGRAYHSKRSWQDEEHTRCTVGMCVPCSFGRQNPPSTIEAQKSRTLTFVVP